MSQQQPVQMTIQISTTGRLVTAGGRLQWNDQRPTPAQAPKGGK